MLTTLESFRDAYEAKITPAEDGNRPSFDLNAALRDAVAVTGRESVHQQ